MTDPHATVAADVRLVLDSPAVPTTVTVSGHVYGVNTGIVTTVHPVATQ